MQRIKRLLKGVRMADERFKVEYPARQTLKAGGPGVTVAVDEFEINLHAMSATGYRSNLHQNLPQQATSA